MTMGEVTATSAPTAQMRYRPDLDGLRAVAVLAVFGSHAPFNHFGGGWIGVDVFFVLSGFLITTLLLAERARTGGVAFRRFYMRRALRLYPALVVIVVLTLLLRNEYAFFSPAKSALAAVSYLSDFAIGFDWFPAGPLGHTWSLAIEEQFYLIWPPVLALLLVRGRSPVSWVIAATLLGWAALVVGSIDATSGLAPDVYYLPWTRFPQLLVGCIVALALSRREVPTWVGRPVVGAAVTVLAGAIWYDAGVQLRIPNLGWQAPLIAVVTAAAIVHLHVSSGGMRAVLGARPLAALGRRSYGFYLYHYPILLFLDQHSGLNRYTLFAAAFVATLAVTWASYRFVELPFLRLKKRYEPAPALA